MRAPRPLRHVGATGTQAVATGLVTALCLFVLAALGVSVSAPSSDGAVRPTATTALRREQHAGIYEDGGIRSYGTAQFFGSPVRSRLAAPVVAMAATPDGGGYWLVTANGAVYAFGDAHDDGGLAGTRLAAPVVAMAATPDGGGYWLVTANGAVYAFGDAHDDGSPAAAGGVPDPVVGFATTPDGGGYWLVTSHGAVYAYGDARYYGSLGGTDLHHIPVVAIASSADGKGYWLVQGGGEVVPYGDAPKLGGMRGHPPVDGIAVTRDGRGYWLVCNDGEVDAFGDAAHLGGNRAARPRPPISGITANPRGGGYWLLDAAAFRFGLAHPSQTVGARIVGIAASQLGPSPNGGHYCNPYGPCEPWCALFATWTWKRAGVQIPRYAFVGDVYDWAKAHTKVLGPKRRPSPGDLVLYGTGPQSVRTSNHIGVVAQVWPDGEIDTVEGDAGPGKGGRTAVVVNGPYLPSQSFFANGFPIYGYAVP